MFSFSALGKREREISHHPVPFFDIPISIEAPTRAIYTHALVDMFVLPFTHSLTHSAIFLFLSSCTRSDDCCMSVKAKLVLTNRNIVCNMDERVHIGWPFRHRMTGVLLDYEPERANQPHRSLSDIARISADWSVSSLLIPSRDIGNVLSLLSFCSRLLCKQWENGCNFSPSLCLLLPSAVPSPFIYHLCAYIHNVGLSRQVIDNVIERRWWRQTEAALPNESIFYCWILFSPRALTLSLSLSLPLLSHCIILWKFRPTPYVLVYMVRTKKEISCWC